MIPFFENQDNIKAFDTSLKSWINTPYMHLTQVKGRGADCVLFIGACLKDIGVFSKLDVEYYSRDWNVFGTKEIALDSFKKNFQNMPNNLEFKEHDINDSDMYGDIIGFSMYWKTMLTNHAAVYIGENKIIHSINRKGVNIIPFSNPMRLRQTKRFRLYYVS